MAESLDFKSLSIQETHIPVEKEVVNTTHSSSVNFINDSNLMVIMRGVSGSGKSTIVKYLMKELGSNCVCSADDFFLKNGRYEYDRKKIGQAHQYCQQKAVQYCEQGHSVVIIDNTNVQKWETDFYVDVAHQCGYIVVMVTPQAQHTTSCEVLAERNKHGVPAKVIQQKISSFNTISPSYFAWFLSKRSTLELFEIRDRELANFRAKEFFDVNFHSESIILHVTSIFLGRIKDTSMKLKEVEKLSKHIGEVTNIKVTAIVITRRTVAARVQVAKAASKFYFNDEGGDEDIHRQRQGHSRLPKGHAAHITLGVANDIETKVAKADMTLSHICAIDQQKSRPVCEDDTTIYYRGDDVVVITLDQPVVFKAMFAAAYR